MRLELKVADNQIDKNQTEGQRIFPAVVGGTIIAVAVLALICVAAWYFFHFGKY